MDPGFRRDDSIGGMAPGFSDLGSAAFDQPRSMRATAL